jgi:hypothetical protein
MQFEHYSSLRILLLVVVLDEQLVCRHQEPLRVKFKQQFTVGTDGGRGPFLEIELGPWGDFRCGAFAADGRDRDVIYCL